MQYKKDEMRQSILNSGEEAFLNLGFTNASLRKIVNNASTTIGNFYNYFDSKEELFKALVVHDYKKFMRLLTEHNTINRPDYLWEESNPKVGRDVLSHFITNIIPEFGNGFILLIQSSKGTQYEDTRELLINEVRNHFIEHIERFGENDNLITYAEIMASQFVDGFTKIFSDYQDKEVRQKLLIDHLLFYMIGTMGIIGDF